MKLAGDQNRSLQSGASNRNGRMRVRRRTQFRTRGEGGREGGREGDGEGGDFQPFQREGERKSLVVKIVHYSLNTSTRESGRGFRNCIPITCSLGPLQAVAVAALILSTTCCNVHTCGLNNTEKRGERNEKY